MSETVEHKQYTPEFKREAVGLIEAGQSACEVSRRLGINRNLLGKWKRQLDLAQIAQANGRQSFEAFPGQGRSHDEELARLRHENAALKMERDVLPSAITIFAEAHPR